MRIKLNTKQFMNVATVVAKSISAKDQQSQTSFKLINGKLLIAHYSGTSLFKGSVDIVELTEPTSEDFWVVSGNQFKLILTVMSKDTDFIELEIKEEGTQFTVYTGNSKLKLPINEITATYNEEQLESLGEVEANSFLSNVLNLTKLIVVDDVLQNHPASCLHIMGYEKTLVLMSTSNIALAEKTLPFDRCIDKDFNILIKPAQANLLQSTTFDGDDIITLYQTKNMFGYIDKNGVLCLVSKINLNPLNYLGFKQVVSTKDNVTVISSQFKGAVDAVSKLCNNNSDIIINITDTKMAIENASNDIIEIDFTGSADKIRMTFNRQSLISLTNILPEKVRFGWAPGNAATNKCVQIQCLDSEGNIDNSLFIIITMNER